ncbi:hypothetical protein NELLIE_8 [Arthrobacter phage Nellie]|uniref:Uncharacterized protein n=4 Tax=Jasminevirus adat TaxID=2560299 RepID=A0A249XN41_9CAUD|nr:hypothetical protein FDI47_gp08 [Arthrobacter phage Adat]ASZ72581.1 hypothetical protein ADAT_8 [Arthrobacter phage Adat]ASZ73163.1 hypothetical protein GURGLEFERB_8 [Arthrobacter phage GurgleFerb]ASZ73727.1 hypothetical protein NELLIE_8 [Arthrobacter phage Nellie]AXH43697.1 hypothetical protein SEA_BRAD_8 [Arthrobacter phage Brad]
MSLHPDKFLIEAKQRVVCEHNQTCRDGKEIEPNDVYIVWFAKTLQNWKALVSTDKFSGTYWEVTYNGDKEEAYVDRYVKANNMRIKDSDVYGVPVYPGWEASGHKTEEEWYKQ